MPTRRTKFAVLALALAAVALPAAAADTYTIDGTHSSIVWSVMHMKVAKFYGTFGDVSGTVTVDAENPAASAFDVTIKTESVSTRAERRDTHLKSPDFFNAAQYPAITLKSKSVKKTGDNKFQAVAELDMHGVKKDVTLDIEQTGSGTHPRGGQLIGFHTMAKIKRSDFGITFMPDGLGDDVDVIISIEAKK